MAAQRFIAKCAATCLINAGPCGPSTSAREGAGLWPEGPGFGRGVREPDPLSWVNRPPACMEEVYRYSLCRALENISTKISPKKTHTQKTTEVGRRAVAQELSFFLSPANGGSTSYRFFFCRRNGRQKKPLAGPVRRRKPHFLVSAEAALLPAGGSGRLRQPSGKAE
jgi:hypothetical protein